MLVQNGPRRLPCDLLVRKGKTACLSAVFLLLLCMSTKTFINFIIFAKRTKQIKLFWEIHAQKENINAQSKLLEEQSKLALVQTRMEMTRVQVGLIICNLLWT